MESVASRDHVALELLVAALVPVANEWTLRIEIVDAHVLDVEVEGRTRVEAQPDEVFDELGLSVDHDRAPSREIAQRDAVALSCELELDPVMDDSLPPETFAGTRLHEQLADLVLDHARPDACLDVLAAAVLEDHVLDPLAVEEMAEREPRRAGADDAHLRPRPAHACPSSSRTRWAIANAPFAAGTPQ